MISSAFEQMDTAKRMDVRGLVEPFNADACAAYAVSKINDGGKGIETRCAGDDKEKDIRRVTISHDACCADENSRDAFCPLKGAI